jgi:threonine aldolase
MRQAGVIAAGSLYAFEHHVDRLAEDHGRAKKLADGLRDAGYDVQPPETNIVLVEVGAPDRFLESLAREGVLATPMTGGTVRFCTHLDVGDAEIEAAIEAASRITSDTLQRWG